MIDNDIYPSTYLHIYVHTHTERERERERERDVYCFCLRCSPISGLGGSIFYVEDTLIGTNNV